MIPAIFPLPDNDRIQTINKKKIRLKFRIWPPVIGRIARYIGDRSELASYNRLQHQHSLFEAWALICHQSVTVPSKSQSKTHTYFSTQKWVSIHQHVLTKRLTWNNWSKAKHNCSNTSVLPMLSDNYSIQHNMYLFDKFGVF